MSDRKPTIPLYVGLFALLYVASLFVIGYTIIFLRIETGTLPNIIALIASSSITSYCFSYRLKRRFSKSECFEIVLGSIATDITVQVSTVLLIADKLDFSDKWIGYLSISITHAAILAMSYSLWKIKQSKLPAA
jgi:hypothetical protein